MVPEEIIKYVPLQKKIIFIKKYMYYSKVSYIEHDHSFGEVLICILKEMISRKKALHI